MRPCFLLEPLEPRIILSAGFIAADGIPGGAIKLDLGQEPNMPIFAILPGGKILAADSLYDDDPACSEIPDGYQIRDYFFRFNPDGSRDPSFGENGLVSFCSSDTYDQLLPMPDGKFLAMSDEGGIFRFSAAGQPDKTFRTVVPDLPIPRFEMYDFEHIGIGQDGQIFSGGQSWDSHDDVSYLGFLSFRPDGTLNRSFGDHGALAAKYSVPFDWGARFVIQRDGKILIGTGDHKDGKGQMPGTLLRFNPDGTPDESFAQGGQFRFGARENIGSVLLQPDGKILLVLSHGDYRANAPDLTLLRLNSDGTLDESFGIDGRSRSWWHGNNYWYNTLLQSDGKIIVADEFEGIVVRFTSSGQLDPTFGFGGAIRLSSVEDDSDFAVDAVFLRPNGHLLLVTQKQKQLAHLWSYSEHLVDITTDPTRPTELISSDGEILLRAITPVLKSPQDDQSSDPPEESGSGSDPDSDSPPTVDPGDNAALENADDPAVQDSSDDLLDEDSTAPFQGDPGTEPWLD